jgi:hypothetical protein
MFRILIAAAMPLALAGCAATAGPADVLPSASPVDPSLGIRNVHHHTVLDGYTHRVPLEPRPWRQQNDRQAPGGDS